MNLSKNKLYLLLGLLLCWHATSALAQKADRDMPLNMEADRVTVDDSNQTSTFEGNVQMRQGSILIEAGKIVITQDKQGYSQVTASGQPAHFRQKRDGTNEFADGYGERIVYNSYTEVAEFIGRARVQREGDDVRGEHIIYNTKTGIFQVFGTKASTPDKPNKGRVTIVIQPKDRSNEEAPPAPAPPAKPPAPSRQQDQP